jgi:hypothetical protein
VLFVAGIGQRWAGEREDGDGEKDFWVKTRSEVAGGWVGVVTGAWRLLRCVGGGVLRPECLGLEILIWAKIF